MEQSSPILDYTSGERAPLKPSYRVAEVVALLSWVGPLVSLIYFRKPVGDSLRRVTDGQTANIIALFLVPVTFLLLGLALLVISTAKRRRIVAVWWCIAGSLFWIAALVGLVYAVRQMWQDFNLR